MRFAMSLFMLAVLAEGEAFSAETVTYSYDALGRLTASSSTGVVNNGVAASSIYDPAGNRTAYAVTGSSNSSGVFGVIVLPLAGFTIIPLTNPAQ